MSILRIRPHNGPAPLVVDRRISGPRNQRVLLIHESLPSRDLIYESLRDRFEVRLARNAEEGWHTALTDSSICAVVTSLGALEIDGYGLLQRIRRSKVARISGVPVIIVADDSDDHSMGDLATSFGASDMMPFSDLGGIPDRLQFLIEPGTVVQTASPDRVLSTLRETLFVNPTPDKPTARPPSSPFNARTEVPMARIDDLNKVLKNLQSSSPGIEASALISTDGLMIASVLAQDMDSTRIGAMTATLLNLGTRAGTELRRGEVSEVIVRGDQGYAVMLSAGRGVLLLVLATEATPLGLIFFDMREAVKGVKTIL